MDESNQFKILPRISFGQAVKNVFGKYATFTGRARRSEYWWFQLFDFIVVFLASILDELLGLGISDTGEGILTIIVTLVLLRPCLSVFWRRLHDMGKSGWNYLWVIIPAALCSIFAVAQLYVLTILVGIVTIVTAVMLVVWCCMDSQPEENQYGPSPKYQQITNVSHDEGQSIPDDHSDSEIIQ